MVDPKVVIAPDYRPGLAICAYEVDERGWDPIEDLSGEPWHPVGARTLTVAADVPEALASILTSHLDRRDCRGLLLIGRTRKGNAFRLQLRAENRTLDRERRQDLLGPVTARATAPAADIVRALNKAGLVADTSSEAEEDTGSYLLYRVLAHLADGPDTPSIGLLRAPVDAPDTSVQLAVKAAAQAMARHLSPLPRSRPN